MVFPAGWTPQGVEANDANITFAEDDYNLAFGENTLRVYWVSANTLNVSGLTGLGTVVFTVPADAAADTYEFRVTNFEITKKIDGKTAVWETGAELTASLTLEAAAATPLSMVTQPVSFTGPLGSAVSISVEATGEGLTYQWWFANAGATSFTKSGNI